MSQPRNFGRGRGQRSAYMANFEPYLSAAAGPFETQYCTDYSSHQMPDMNSMNHSLDSFSTPGAAYVANYEGPADEGWYLDSGATHHLTNNMANMHIREQFNGSDQLIISNGQGLTITHIGDAFLTLKNPNAKHKHTPIALKDILLVPSITKNLLSISKLTVDNNLSVRIL